MQTYLLKFYYQSIAEQPAFLAMQMRCEINEGDVWEITNAMAINMGFDWCDYEEINNETN